MKGFKCLLSFAFLAALPAMLALSAPSTRASASLGLCGSRSGQVPRTYSHVITIMLENKAYSEVDGSSPYLNGLSKRCGLASNYFAITHPSLPNYLALTSGDTRFSDNCDSCSTSAVSIFEQVGTHGWREYAESMPNAGFTGAEKGLYEKHHNPASYYRRIAASYRTRAVPLGSTSAGALVADLRRNTLPRYSFISPNECHNEHDCDVPAGDAWLSKWVPKIVSSPAYTRGGTALFITYDEGSDTDNRVYTVIVSPYTKPGTIARAKFTHYSLLKTQESMLGLHCLGLACGASTMRGAFGL
jgi:phosphatidylinositol-3-phosphatase